MKTKTENATLLNNARKSVAVYDDPGLFVEHSIMVSAIDQTRKQFLACITAYADLYRYGDDDDRNLVTDSWDFIQETFSEQLAEQKTQVKVWASKAKEISDQLTDTKLTDSRRAGLESGLVHAQAMMDAANGQYAQYRNARTYTADKIKVEFVNRHLILDTAHGSFDVTPMTSEQVSALRQMNLKGTAKVRAAKSIKAGLNSRQMDKQATKQTGADKAQLPTPAAKQLNLVDRAAALIKEMNLDELKVHLKAVEAAIRTTERLDATAKAAQQRRKVKAKETVTVSK